MLFSWVSLRSRHVGFPLQGDCDLLFYTYIILAEAISCDVFKFHTETHNFLAALVKRTIIVNWIPLSNVIQVLFSRANRSPLLWWSHSSPCTRLSLSPYSCLRSLLQLGIVVLTSTKLEFKHALCDSHRTICLQLLVDFRVCQLICFCNNQLLWSQSLCSLNFLSTLVQVESGMFPLHDKVVFR